MNKDAPNNPRLPILRLQIILLDRAEINSSSEREQLEASESRRHKAGQWKTTHNNLPYLILISMSENMFTSRKYQSPIKAVTKRYTS